MTKRDSRIMSRLETRRGFVPLEDCTLLGCLGYDSSRLTRIQVCVCSPCQVPGSRSAALPAAEGSLPTSRMFVPTHFSAAYEARELMVLCRAQSCGASLSTPSRCDSKICLRTIAVRRWRRWRPCSSSDLPRRNCSVQARTSSQRNLGYSMTEGCSGPKLACSDHVDTLVALTQFPTRMLISALE